MSSHIIKDVVEPENTASFYPAIGGGGFSERDSGDLLVTSNNGNGTIDSKKEIVVI